MRDEIEVCLSNIFENEKQKLKTLLGGAKGDEGNKNLQLRGNSPDQSPRGNFRRTYQRLDLVQEKKIDRVDNN